MKFTCPKALPFTKTWFGVTSTASAISGFDTEKRPTGRSKLITRDWPTSTLTATGSWPCLNDALYEVAWAFAIELIRTTISDASNKLTRREIGERLYMIFAPFGIKPGVGVRALFALLREIYVALLGALDHFNRGS